jgi:hypothetical protein
MPCFFSPQEIKTMEKAGPFSFTKGMPVMRFTSRAYSGGAYSDLLFDLEQDPLQEHPITGDMRLTKQMMELLTAAMHENDAPEELYARLGI